MWKAIWEPHKGKIIGTAFGLFFGFIYLIWGFWEMLVTAFIVLIGFYVGWKADHQEDSLQLSQLYKWITDRWRMFK